jgi:hypothetical protein
MAKSKSLSEEQTVIEEPIIESQDASQEPDPGHKTRAYKDMNYKLTPTVYPQVEEATAAILDGEEPTA